MAIQVGAAAASTVTTDVHQPVLTLREKLGYGSGDVGFNFLFDMGQLYLLKFFTDQLGLNPAVAGSVFLVAKVWDAFADVTVGSWIDNQRRPGRFGRYRSFIIYGTLPLAIILVASFFVPDLSLTGRTIWAYLIYMAFGTVYSIANIPYGALIPAMTRNPQERAVLSSLRQGGGTLGLLIATVAFWPIVNSFGADMQQGYIVAVCIFGALGAALVYMMCFLVKERFAVKPVVDEQALTKVPLRTQYKLLFANRPLIGLCAANLFIFSAFNVRLAVQVYFAEYVLHDKWALSWLGLFAIGCVFPGVALVPYLTKRLGKRQTYILGCLIWFVADLFALFFVHNTASLVIFSCFAYFGSALPNSLNWAMISDCVEFGEWKNRVRNQALTYSAFTWFRKMSQAIAGFVPGIVLAVVGYVPNAINQSDSTLTGIRGLMFFYPLVMCLLAIASIWFIYTLTDQRFVEIAEELDKRQAAQATTASEVES